MKIGKEKEMFSGIASVQVMIYEEAGPPSASPSSCTFNSTVSSSSDILTWTWPNIKRNWTWSRKHEISLSGARSWNADTNERKKQRRWKNREITKKDGRNTATNTMASEGANIETKKEAEKKVQEERHEGAKETKKQRYRQGEEKKAEHCQLFR